MAYQRHNFSLKRGHLVDALSHTQAARTEVRSRNISQEDTLFPVENSWQAARGTEVLARYACLRFETIPITGCRYGFRQDAVGRFRGSGSW